MDDQQWWSSLDACVHSHITRHSDHRVSVEQQGSLRTFTLGSVELCFALACQTVCVQLCTSGQYTKSDVFWVEQEYNSNTALVRHVALMCKCMLIMDATNSLDNVDTALARDSPTQDGLNLDLVLRSALFYPKYRIMAMIPAHGAIIATVTFTELFWTEVSTTAVKQTRKHFKTIYTLIEFIRRDRRSRVWTRRT